MRAFACRTGPCDRCQRPAPLWESLYKVLDFGVPGMAPVEPGDLHLPRLCDACELLRRQADPDDPLYVGRERKNRP